MARSKYIDHIDEILDMRYNEEKKWIEIVRYLNTNFEINATENSLIIFARRYVDKNKWTDFNVFLMTATTEDNERARRGDIPPNALEGIPSAVNYLDKELEAIEEIAKKENIPVKNLLDAM